MNKRTKRIGAIAVATATAFGIGATAFAAFILSGSVVASGSVATPENLVARDASIVGPLWPGACNDVAFTLHNPNPRDAKVRGIESFSLDTRSLRDVVTFAYEVGSNTQGTLPASFLNTVVPANGDVQIVLPGAVCLDEDATNDVAGTNFNVDLNLLFKAAV